MLAVLAAFKDSFLLWLFVPYSCFLWWKNEKTWLLAIIAVFSFSAFFYTKNRNEDLKEHIPEHAVITWSGTYTINGAKLRGFSKTDSGAKIYAVMTFSNKEEKEKYENISLSGAMFRVKGKLTPANMPAHQYAFSMDEYLKSQGAIGIYEIEQAEYIGKKKSISSVLAQQRLKVKKHIERTFPKRLAAEAEALIIGDQGNVDEDLSRAYQKLGITHLFAISGLHVALITLLLFEIMLRCHVRKEHATLAIMIVLPLYACLAGGAPSVWRSVTVVEIMMISRASKSLLTVDDALSISFILLLAYQPAMVFQIGFQLSYLATAALIYSSRVLQSSNHVLLQSFYMTFVCQLLVYPLLIYHFFELSLSSFVANLVFVPLFSFVILPINLIMLVLTGISLPLSNLIFAVYEPLRTWLTSGILFFKEIPYQMWVSGRPDILLCVLAMIGVLTAFVYIEKKYFVRAAAWILFPVLIIHFASSLHRDLRITYLNVGQGDSAVIELPYRKKVYVIDTGGLLRFGQEKWKEPKNEYEVGRKVVVPYLKGRGIRSVDAMILTHADADHVEGAEEVIEELHVKEIHISPNSWEKAVMGEVLKLVKEKRIPLKERMAGYSWAEHRTEFKYISPTDTNYEGNNDSLVLLLKFGEFKTVFTGDLEELGEKQLIGNSVADIAGLTILKAGHHGSKTSSSEPFLNITKPLLTIFSTGLNNRYRHPSQEVVDRYQRLGYTTLNTAESGSIEVSVKEDSWQIHTTAEFLEKKKALSK